MAWRTEVISPCRGLNVVCPVTIDWMSDELLLKSENFEEADGLERVESRPLSDLQWL